MPTSKTYRALADEADRAATDAKSALDREQFLKFAEHWRILAHDAQLGEDRRREIEPPAAPRDAVSSGVG